MLKKTISYLDLDNNPVTAEWHFSLDTAELLEMKMTAGTGLNAALETIIGGGNKEVVITAFKEIMQASVGRRVGNRFVKTQDMVDEFMQTGAYAALLLEFMQNTMSGVDFIMGVVPGDLANKLNLNDVRQQMSDAGLLNKDSEQVLERLKGGFTPVPEPERQMKVVDVSLDPSSQTDNVEVIGIERREEEPYFAGRTKTQLEAMSAEDLNTLILSASGNVPAPLLRYALAKRHAE